MPSSTPFIPLIPTPPPAKPRKDTPRPESANDNPENCDQPLPGNIDDTSDLCHFNQ